MGGMEIGTEAQKVESESSQFLLFSLDDEGYGIDTKYVIEIIGRVAQVTEIPQMPNYIKGIINLRGKIIPTMDVRLRFMKKPREYDDRTCIIVIKVNGLFVGLIVDRVLEVLSISNEDIALPPQISKNYHHRYIKGIAKINKDVRLLLDCEMLLNVDEFVNLVEIS